MKHSEAEYARLSDQELRAADTAASPQDRIAHLESAFRFAQLACADRKKPANELKLEPRR